MSKTPAAAYLRVSTGMQHHENQKPDVLRVAAVRDLDLTGRIYEEVASTRRARPIYERMMQDAREGRFKVLVFWALDRLGRTMWETVNAVRELDRYGVQCVSVKDGFFDTTGPVRDLLLSVFAWCAQHERDLIRERTNAGLAKARARGVKFGRPKRRPSHERVAMLRAEGLSWSEVAVVLSCTIGSARRAFAEMGSKTANGETGV